MSTKISNIQILKKAAKKNGYNFGFVDQPYSEAIYVTNGEKYFIARSKSKYGMYPTNPKFAEQLADDKDTTKRFLKKFGFRVIKGKIFHISNPGLSSKSIKERDSVMSSFKYAEKIGYPVFVKPNSGSRGANARIIFNKTGLKKHIENLKKDSVVSFLIEKFTVRPEYRIFVVNGRVQFMYRKQRVTITGTGKHTIQELLDEQNFQPDKKYLSSLLKKEKKTVKSVLDSKKELFMQETANISLGAKITDYREIVPREVHAWAKKLYQTTGLGVFGVDVFTKGTANESSKYLIIEVNSNPALSGIYTKGHHTKTFTIWGKIMDTFFSVT